MKFLDMGDYELKGKTVLVRFDANCPIDPTSGEFLDERRLYACRKTCNYLSESGARIVILAHQGRPGDEYDFTTLDNHAERLSKIIGKNVGYVDDIFGSQAQDRIKSLGDGEILMLENVRFYSEETLQRPADSQTRTHLVRSLSGCVDFFVNDAFAAAHRSQPSLVGFTPLMPSFPGKTMEEELRVLSKVQKATKKMSIFLLGGSKAKDSLKVTDKALGNSAADKILTGGVPAIVFLAAKGYDIGDKNQEFLRGKGLDNLIPYAKELLDKYEDRIELPMDLALDRYGKRMEIGLSELPMPYRITDIGSGTIGRYSYLLSTADKVLANGPMGYFEVDAFARGTNDLLTALAKTDAFTVIGGGHLAVAAENMGLRKEINHISTAGGACILYLAGESLPVLDALEASAEKFGKGAKKAEEKKEKEGEKKGGEK